MVAEASGRDDGCVTIIVPIALVAAVSLAGAVLAGTRAVTRGTTPGRRAGLWAIAVILSVLAVAAGLLAYWLWRFSVEFTW